MRCVVSELFQRVHWHPPFPSSREVVTLGKSPYPDLENSEVVDAICDDGYRMPCPENCPSS